ncbi:MAG TPA: sigma-70 family RNA polymerase sigma factor [Vicinamibacterales bacterium]|nr:sigma-70 family RNA polymerase sigma factor [Vicinamibacterales bacterium]
MATPEPRLVERCRQGDEAAFRELVDQYKGMVFALIARSVSNRARAEEVAQDVFLKVHRGLPYFRGESKLSTWIYRIAINAIAQERPELATTSLDDVVDDDRPKVQPGLDDRAFGDVVLKDRLQKAIDRLPIQYQVLINGHYMKGMRYEELAEALDMPMGTVKTHLHRAKRQLRRLLETEFR